MQPLNTLLDAARQQVRRFMGTVARVLDRSTNGKLQPNAITITALLAHLPVAWLIATQNYLWGALLLVVFGLMDALDGQLARIQNKVSNGGMLLDATTDRMKEVLLYSGAAYALVSTGRPYMAVWAVVACGASLLVSYVKAKGETAVAGGNLPANEVNRLFQDGIMRFEVRMAALVIGLLFSQLAAAVIFIAIGSWLTAFGRLISISRRLNVQS